MGHWNTTPSDGAYLAVNEKLYVKLVIEVFSLPCLLKKLIRITAWVIY